ncbi:MAG TPA: hypothetical protein VFT70_18210 [Nocardioides sp.]|nr:hypothetical protein [Nocardioides sp.]
MRRLLGTLAVLLVLPGCGDDTRSSVPPPPRTPGVMLVHATAGRGDAEPRATDVTDPADLTAYVEPFSDDLAAKVTKAVGEVDGETILAQVVSVGCDVPPGAHVRGDDIVAAKVVAPTEECFAPVTTVAVAGVD